MAVNQRTRSRLGARPDVRIGAVIAVAALVAFVVWLLVRGGGSGSSGQPSAEPIAPMAASPVATSATSRSRSAGRSTGSGPRTDKVYELQRTSQDRIYVRYLPPGVSVGTKQAGYPLVGTYPVSNAYDVLKSLAKTSGESSFTAPRGAIAVYSNSRPDQHLPRLSRAPTCRSRSTTRRRRRPARSSPRGGSSRSVADGAARLLGRVPARAGGALARLRQPARARRRGEAAAAAAACRPA